MGAITILPAIIFCIYAILLQTVNSLALFKAEDEESSFKTVCSTNCQDPDSWNDTRAFPLYTCSCSPSCATYEDCCYDSPYRKETTWEHKSMCVTVYDRGPYRVISGCPAGKISHFCHDSIGHHPPVTSRRTNITYANLFCALCNEDGDSLTTWNVELKCDSDKKDDPEDSTTLIYQSNHIWKISKSTKRKSLCMFYAHFGNFNVLDGLELRSCFDERKIPECSPSWRDAEIKELCRSYEDPVYFGVGDKLFRNIHCAQCNYVEPTFARCMPHAIEVLLQKGLTDPRQFCRNRRSKACVDYLEGSKGWGYPLSGLVNIYEVSCVPDPENQRCCDGTKYDLRSNTCRKIESEE